MVNEADVEGQSAISNILSTYATCFVVFDVIFDLLLKVLTNVVGLQLYLFVEDGVLFPGC